MMSERLWQCACRDFGADEARTLRSFAPSIPASKAIVSLRLWLYGRTVAIEHAENAVDMERVREETRGRISKISTLPDRARISIRSMSIARPLMPIGQSITAALLPIMAIQTESASARRLRWIHCGTATSRSGRMRFVAQS
jgi:hypothetical protein